MRFVVSSIVTRFFAIAVAVLVCAIAVLWNVQDSELQRSDPFIEPTPADATVFLQGLQIQLAREPRRTNNHASQLTLSGGRNASSNAENAMSTLRTKISDVIQVRTIDNAGITIVLVTVLLVCTCLAAGSTLFPEKFGLTGSAPRERAFSALPNDPRRISQITAASLQPQSQSSMHSILQTHQTLMSRNSPRPGLSERSLAAPATSTPITTGASLSGTLSRLIPLPPEDQIPALCPSMVMPLVEAHFGIPLLEISTLMKYGHGELTVVGLSTNPLLRAVVKRHGNARSLEISMPERNGIPRATLVPASQENWSRSGPTTLEIRDSQNRVYGSLVMTEQATYVTHGGRTFLSIGGQAASLQLVLKSSDGSKAADVRCSSEAFGGQDHVELRVEPGVDTVLVLAVVLAVLLLSPWSVDEKQ